MTGMNDGDQGFGNINVQDLLNLQSPVYLYSWNILVSCRNKSREGNEALWNV